MPAESARFIMRRLPVPASPIRHRRALHFLHGGHSAATKESDARSAMGAGGSGHRSGSGGSRRLRWRRRRPTTGRSASSGSGRPIQRQRDRLKRLTRQPRIARHIRPDGSCSGRQSSGRWRGRFHGCVSFQAEKAECDECRRRRSRSDRCNPADLPAAFRRTLRSKP